MSEATSGPTISWRRWRAALLVAVVALAAYGSNLGNDFAMDDRYNVVDNTQLRSLSNVPGLFTQRLGGHLEGGIDETISRNFWRPVTLTSWAIDHAIFGLSPAGFHLVNDLLHALISALVLLVVGRLTGSRVAAMVAGLAFALHPLHSEAVNLVTYRTDLLATLWCVVALWLRARQGRSGVKLMTSVAIVACYALGLGSKESAVTLPGWLVVMDLAGGRLAGLHKRPVAVLRRWLPLYGALAVVLAGYFAARSSLVSAQAMPFFGALSETQTVASVLKIHAFYLRMLVIPWPLNPFWDMSTLQPALSLTDPQALLGALALGVSLVAVVKALAPRLTEQNVAGQSPAIGVWVALGVTWWWLGLLPVSHLVALPVGAGERFCYLPSIGAALALGVFADHLWMRIQRRRPALLAGAVAVAMVAFALTAWRGTHWRNDRTLMERVVVDLPDSFNGHHLLGQLHYDAGRCAEATRSFEAAERVLPGFAPNQPWLTRARAGCAETATGRPPRRTTAPP